MKIIVCGGRYYNDKSYVFGVLDALHSMEWITRLAHGDAKGADTLAKEWAIARGVQNHAYPVTADDWRVMGKAAGFIRNKAMYDAEKPDLVVAFPGGNGTKNMCEIAAKGFSRVIQYNGIPECLTDPSKPI